MFFTIQKALPYLMAQTLLSAVPMKRFGQPEEVEQAVLFLASADSSYLTGGEINVDSGMGQL